MDIGLPVMDGYEIATRLRARLGDAIRLIAMTGCGQPENRERSRQAGFDLHLVKPVDSTALLGAIDSLLGAIDSLLGPAAVAASS